MSRIRMKKEGMFKYACVVCPNILKKINKLSEVARNCTTRFCEAIANKRNDVEDYVDVCYNKETYLKGPVANQVPEAPQQTENAVTQQTENAATQQTDGFDALQPTQASQNAPIS
ncbi:hypothetical protein BUALT_Bualt11G0015100 [Buddleja alternifolia]|uniref:Uncharacterized protein n=1 Tax=Buddleja alternifolia TaxID=168488 RepID=A0AAV6X2I8_9LAMI|nr:hypothetical protein BUALT_Bualt11G0015100 [Buddleja alternifolia]